MSLRKDVVARHCCGVIFLVKHRPSSQPHSRTVCESVRERERVRKYVCMCDGESAMRDGVRACACVSV